jgi:hypothetical protein
LAFVWSLPIRAIIEELSQPRLSLKGIMSFHAVHQFVCKWLIVCAVAALALSSAFTSTIVLAHAEHGKPQYGGVVGEAGDFQVELVVKADTMTMYITDHGKALSAKGAAAKVTLLVGATKSEANLTAAADGKTLEAKGAYKVAKGTKAVAVVTLAGKPAKTVRFEWK